MHIFSIVQLFCLSHGLYIASLAPHTPTDSYFYTDTSGFAWDRQLGYWTKDSLAIDLSNSVLSPSPLPHDSSTITLPSSSSLDGSEYASKTDSSNYNPTLYGRPLSQLSYRSDDLQTIPSQEVSCTYCCRCIQCICL